jgi:CubicO group peptidase (beta-lactamase class C family)
MTIIYRYVFAALLIVLPLKGCGPPPQKASLKGDGRTSAGAGYIGQGEYTGTYWPTREWRKCKPESVGMSSEKLLEAIEYAATPAFNTDGLAVVRNGYIVGEAYWGNFRIDSKHVSHSMAKSFTGSLVGIAIDKGQIEGLDVKICKYYDEWDCDDVDDFRSRITLRHAMTLTTGLEWKEDWTVWDPNTNDALKMGASGHFVKYMAQRNGLYEPGRRFVYSTGDPMLLSKVIQDATGMTAFDYAGQNLFKPLNITRVSWDKDVDGYTSTAWGLYATVRDYAKFGYLYLNKGRWENRIIVSEGWVEKSTRTDPSVKMWAGYGYLWHVNLPYRLKWNRSAVSPDAIPPDGYMAEGVMGQSIVIIPSKDLVIVRVAKETAGGRMDLVKFLAMILEAIMPSTEKKS